MVDLELRELDRGGSQIPLSIAWSAERRELHQWFRENASGLAEPYKGALLLLSAPHFPGRIHFVAHVVRDICNRLPDFRGAVERRRLDYEKEVDRVTRAWPKPAISPSAYADGNDATADAAEVSIPKVAALAVDELVRRHGGKQTNRDVIYDMFSSAAEADQAEHRALLPIVAEFHQTAHWFMQRAHLRSKPSAPQDETELLTRFAHFERIVLSLVRSFFETAEDLNELIQQANARVG